MKRLLFAPLACAALLLSTVAASAAPRPPYHFSPREQARWEAAHRPAPRPEYRRPLPPRLQPLPPHQPVAYRPVAPPRLAGCR